MEKSAIEAIQAAQQVAEVTTALAELKTLQHPMIAVPAGVELESLEGRLAGRVRQRGTFKATTIAHFVAYCAGALPEGSAPCFVAPESMGATAIFNMGTAQSPGHCDDKAVLALPDTPEYKQLQNLNGKRVSQTELAELLEEWGDYMACYSNRDAVDDNSPSTMGQAIASVRKFNIEARRESSSTEEAKRSERSVAESVELKADHLPGLIAFSCVPHLGLQKRDFWLRVSAVIRGGDVTFALRIIKLDLHQEELRDELLAVLEESLPKYSVFVGAYTVGS